MGGNKLIRTLGGKFYKIRPVDGFAAQLASAVVILSASLVGGPVSTTQVVSSAIMGVGAAERVNKVRWGVAQEIATAWLLTIPATALVAAGLYWVLSQVHPLIIHFRKGLYEYLLKSMMLFVLAITPRIRSFPLPARSMWMVVE